MGSIMTRMPCMRVRLRRGPRSATHPGHRPRVEGPTTSWDASTCTSSGSRGSLPAPTATGSGPLWGLLWCDGGVWPWVSLAERKAPVASSGCSHPGRRAPRAPVREGQRQRRPAHTSAVASPTASARHGFCSLSLAEAKKPRQDALWCGWREATGVFLFERDTYGHTPPSHHSRPHRGPLPVAVGEGILPLEPADVQVEAPQECSAHPPWACGRGA